MQQVQVSGLMNRTVVTTTADAMLSELVSLITQQKVSCVVVLEANKPVGIVTESDLVRLLGQLIAEQISKQIRVGEFMTTSPVLIEQTTPLFDALVIAQSRQIRHLPIVDAKGILCGILGYADLALAYEHVIEQQREIIEKELSAETQQLREANAQLKALAMEDPLLGIGNRRSMEVDLHYTHNMAVRYRRPYSIALYDVDYFKQYNDHYGRQAGDEALKLVANHIRWAIRKADRLYHYGDGKLLVLLAETGGEGGKLTAERIVVELAERNIPHARSVLGILTMSGGVATVEPGGEDNYTDWQALVDTADSRLYEAKFGGRNRVVCGTINASESRRASGQI